MQRQHVRGLHGRSLGALRRSICLKKRSCRASVAVAANGKPLQVVFVSTEVAPWSQVGGLADVAAALPAALAARGHRVMTVAPRYASYTDVWDTGLRVPVQAPLEPTPDSDGSTGAADGSTGTAAHEAQPAAVQGRLKTAAPGVGEAVDAGAAGAAAGAHSPADAEGVIGGTQAAASDAGASGIGAGAAAAAPAPATALGAAAAAGAPPPNAAGPAAAAATLSTSEVRLFMTHASGVDRVFVDHPLFEAAPSDDRSGQLVGTYREGSEQLAASYSILCQAALAAPLLLWPRRGGGAGGSAPEEQSLLARLRQGGAPAALDDRAWLQWRLQHPQGLVNGLAAPLLLSDAPGAVLSRHDLAAALRGAGRSDGGGARAAAGAAVAPGAEQDAAVVFVGNDWPCGVLPLWLQEYRQLAAQQHQPPALEQQRQQQDERAQQRRAQQRLQQQHGREALQAPAAASETWAPQAAAAAAATPVVAANTGPTAAAELPAPLLEAQRQLQELLEREAALGNYIRELRQRLEEMESEGEGLADTVGAAAAGPQGDAGPAPAPAGAAGHAPASGAPDGAAALAAAPSPSAGDALLAPPLSRAPPALTDARGTFTPEDLARFQCWVGRLLGGARVAMAVHNAAHEGTLPGGDPELRRLGLPASVRAALLAPLRGAAGVGRGVSQLASALGGLLFGGPSGGDADAAPPAVQPTAVQAAAASAVVELGQGLDDDAVGAALAAALAAGGPPGAGWVPPPPPPEPSLLRAGVASADAVVTVSPAYARELLGSRQAAGPTLRAALEGKGVAAVLNGLDTQRWDPEGDVLLPRAARYGRDRVRAGKAAAKALLQLRLGLERLPGVPLVAFLGRLDPQKGADLLLCCLPQLLGSGRPGAPGARRRPRLQLAMLGAGQPWLEAAVSQLAARFPGAAAGVAAFNEPLAHLLLAGADYLVIPSRFEPCGLVALAALRYGTLPIASATGGLRDIVTPDIGFLLPPLGEPRPRAAAGGGAGAGAGGFRADADALATGVLAAVGEYGRRAFVAKRAAAMAVDVSWDRPAGEWEALLQALVAGASGAAAGDDGVAAGDGGAAAGDGLAEHDAGGGEGAEQALAPPKRFDGGGGGGGRGGGATPAVVALPRLQTDSTAPVPPTRPLGGPHSSTLQAAFVAAASM